MYRAGQALERLLEYQDVKLIADVGSGTGEQAQVMRDRGKDVYTISLIPPADMVGDYMNLFAPEQFDGIWASHVLEHQPNPNDFLKKCFGDLRDGGVLAVTVPPMKTNIVGGHVTLWNAGLLLYHLVLAGFDCREARVSPVYSSGPGFPPYNISVIVRKVEAKLPTDLHMDSGDIEKLAEFFPLPVYQGFDGNLQGIRW